MMELFIILSVLLQDLLVHTSCLLGVYGGKSDQDVDKHNKHTVTRQKMVALYDLMLGPYKYKGCCVVMEL